MLILTLTMLLVAPAAAREARPTKTEVDAAQQQWVDCLMEQGAAMDDGRSPIGNVAAQVTDRCHPLLVEAAAVTSRGENSGVRERMLERFLEMEVGAADAVIRRLRGRR